VKLTANGPMEGQTPDSLLALHDAGYRESSPGSARAASRRRLRCGHGDARSGGPTRIVGVDLRTRPPRRSPGPTSVPKSADTDVEFSAMDGAALWVRAASFDAVLLLAHHRALRMAPSTTRRARAGGTDDGARS